MYIVLRMDPALVIKRRDVEKIVDLIDSEQLILLFRCLNMGHLIARSVTVEPLFNEDSNRKEFTNRI